MRNHLKIEINYSYTEALRSPYHGLYLTKNYSDSLGNLLYLDQSYMRITETFAKSPQAEQARTLAEVAMTFLWSMLQTEIRGIARITDASLHVLRPRVWWLTWVFTRTGTREIFIFTVLDTKPVGERALVAKPVLEPTGEQEDDRIPIRNRALFFEIANTVYRVDIVHDLENG